MIACLLVIPLALICGPIRGIPWFWRIVDCSFGVFGLIPLIVARRMILRMSMDGTSGKAPYQDRTQFLVGAWFELCEPKCPFGGSNLT